MPLDLCGPIQNNLQTRTKIESGRKEVIEIEKKIIVSFEEHRN